MKVQDSLKKAVADTAASRRRAELINMVAERFPDAEHDGAFARDGRAEVFYALSAHEVADRYDPHVVSYGASTRAQHALYAVVRHGDAEARVYSPRRFDVPLGFQRWHEGLDGARFASLADALRSTCDAVDEAQRRADEAAAEASKPVDVVVKGG